MAAPEGLTLLSVLETTLGDEREDTYMPSSCALALAFASTSLALALASASTSLALALASSAELDMVTGLVVGCYWGKVVFYLLVPSLRFTK